VGHDVGNYHEQLGWPGKLVALACLIPPALGAYLHYRAWNLDDAYIVYRVARNLRNLGEWSFNPGDALNPVTSALWPALLATVSPWTGGPISGAHLLGALWLLLAGFTLHSILARHLSSALALLPSFGLLFVLANNRTWGLETNLFIALALVFVLLEETQRSSWPALALLILARPDGVIFVGLKLIADRRRGRSLRLGGPAVAAALLAPWVLFSLHRFGSVLPRTLGPRIQQGHSDLWGSGNDYLRGLWAHATALGVVGLALAVLAGCGIYLLIRRRSGLLHLVAFVAIQQVAYGILGVPNYHWYYAPLDAVVAIAAGYAAVVGLQAGLERALPPTPARWMRLAAAFATCLALSVAGWTEGRTDSRDELYRQATESVRPQLEAASTIALVEVGTVGYLSDLRVVDLTALTSPNPEFVTGAHSDEFFRSPPDLVLLNEPMPRLAGALYDDPRFDLAYQRAGELGALALFARRPTQELANGGLERRLATRYPAFEPAAEAGHIGSRGTEVRCHLDSLAGHAAGASDSALLDGPVLTVAGWALAVGSVPAEIVRVRLRSEEHDFEAAAGRIDRPDIATAFGSELYRRAGFELSASVVGVPPDTYSISIIQEGPRGETECRPGQLVRVRAEWRTLFGGRDAIDSRPE
jgi:arabinofuranosyltransferase